jgi:tRNA (cytidine/uridine-2'-O-)-methyltransferase
LFGSETSGLPAAIRDSFDPQQRVRLPMRPGQRSLNLSNAVAVAVFEAWRQNGYAGSSDG